MESMLFPVALLLVGILLMIVELFVPSGGVIGALSAICFIGAVVFALMVDLAQGLAFFLVAAIVVPIIFGAMLKVWPRTPLGKMIFADPPKPEAILPDGDHYREIRELIGKRGIAKTKMLPSGSIRVDGKTYDAVSNGLAIDEGQKVEVMAVKGNHIVVRPITAITYAESNSDDILSQSPELLGIDNLDEPLDPNG